MSDEYDIFDNIRMQAMAVIDSLDEQITYHQHEIDSLKSEKRKLQSVIKAASPEPLIPEKKNDKPKKQLGITDKTRTNVTSAIKTVTQDGALDFSIPAIAENMHANGNNPSSVGNAIKVLREEGFVRLVGKEGVTPIYRWAGE